MPMRKLSACPPPTLVATTATTSPSIDPASGDLCLEQGEHRVVCLGGNEVGRVAAGLLVLSTLDDEQVECPTLGCTGDWLGVEWQGQPSVPVSLTALTAVRITWPSASPAAATADNTASLLRQALVQHKRRAAELLALRTGTAEQRCRQFLRLMAQAVPSPAQPKAQVTAKGAPGELPALKEIARLLDLAPETACRALARARKSLAAAGAQAPVRQSAWSYFGLPGTASAPAHALAC